MAHRRLEEHLLGHGHDLLFPRNAPGGVALPFNRNHNCSSGSSRDSFFCQNGVGTAVTRGNTPSIIPEGLRHIAPRRRWCCWWPRYYSVLPACRRIIFGQGQSASFVISSAIRTRDLRSSVAAMKNLKHNRSEMTTTVVTTRVSF